MLKMNRCRSRGVKGLSRYPKEEFVCEEDLHRPDKEIVEGQLFAHCQRFYFRHYCCKPATPIPQETKSEANFLYVGY